jgi:hypothetical protein
MIRRLFSTTALSFLVLTAVGGCGSGKVKTVPVEGIVTLDGVPVKGATVTFTPPAGAQGTAPATGITGSDGVFHLTTHTTGDGAAPGDYVVTISKKSTTGSSSGMDMKNMSPSERAAAAAKMGAATMDKEGKTKADKPKDEVPASYGSAATSGLKAQVPTDGPIKFNLRAGGG